MSPLHFQQDGLKQQIQQLLQQYKVPPDLLELEITESVVMDEPKIVIEALHKLKSYGIKVAIDGWEIVVHNKGPEAEFFALNGSL